MPKFTTTKGQEFRVKVTIPKIKRIRDELDIDLGKLDQFFEVAADISTFVDCLYLMCEKQCDKLGWSGEQFGESLTGDAIEEAWKAFEKAFLNFYPSRQRKTFAALLARTKAKKEKSSNYLITINVLYQLSIWQRNIPSQTQTLVLKVE